MALTTTIPYSVAGQFTYSSSLITFASGAAKLVNTPPYSMANPAITTQYNVIMTALSGFSASVTVAGSDLVKYQLKVNGEYYYYNTTDTEWQAAQQEAYAYSNTASEINSAASTLLSDLELTAPVYVSAVAMLHSNDGTTTPTLTSLTYTYSFTEATYAAINLNTITASLKDILGQPPTYSTTQPQVLYCKADRAFVHGTRIIQPFTQSANFNSSGNCALQVIETETPGYPLSFFISYFEGNSRKTVKFKPVVVPDTAGSYLSQLTTVDVIDFG